MAWLFSHPRQFISKNLVGHAILASVTLLVYDEDLSQKLTGMLIDLPWADIELFLSRYDVFKARVQEAYWRLKYHRLVNRIEDKKPALACQ